VTRVFCRSVLRLYEGASFKEQHRLENWNWKLAVQSTRTEEYRRVQKSTRARMEHVLVICEVGRLAVAL
jgi:hypothetical protein